MEYSKNNNFKELVGCRPEGVTPIDYPCELGYQCPVCKIEWDEGLQWSEYNGFLWCENCNTDYPTCLCTTDINQAVLIYFSAVKDAVEKYQEEHKEYHCES